MSCSSCGKTLLNGVVGLTKVATRTDIAPYNLIQQRRDICRHCDESTKNPKYINHKCRGLTMFSLCKQCNCIISAKSQLATEKCPLGLW